MLELVGDNIHQHQSGCEENLIHLLDFIQQCVIGQKLCMDNICMIARVLFKSHLFLQFFLFCFWTNIDKPESYALSLATTSDHPKTTYTKTPTTCDKLFWFLSMKRMLAGPSCFTSVHAVSDVIMYLLLLGCLKRWRLCDEQWCTTGLCWFVEIYFLRIGFFWMYVFLWNITVKL